MPLPSLYPLVHVKNHCPAKSTAKCLEESFNRMEDKVESRTLQV